MTKIIPEASLIPGECYLLEDGRKALWLGKAFRHRLADDSGGIQNYATARPVAILRPALTPEEVEAAVQATCHAGGWIYHLADAGPTQSNLACRQFRDLLTRHAVAGGDGDDYKKVNWQLEDNVDALTAQLAEAKARIAESENNACQLAIGNAELGQQLAEARARIAALQQPLLTNEYEEVVGQLQRANRTIVAQAHEIRELKEARR